MRPLICAFVFASAASFGALGQQARAQPVVVIIGGPTPAPARVTPRHRARRVVAHTTRTVAPAFAGQSDPGARTSQAIVRYALAFLGRPYVWGGQSPAGFDCSGYTWYAFHMLGIAIPRTADAQFAFGRVVGQPLPGDLVFFQTYDYGASHVGIYLGRGLFVSSIGQDVHVSSFGSEYFRSRFIGARRVARVE